MSAETFPERDILQGELDTLKRVLAMVRITLDPPGIDPEESARKDMEKWKALLSIKAKLKAR